MGKAISKKAGEKWKKIDFESVRKQYAVSDSGRVAGYTDSLFKDGEEVTLNKSQNGIRFLPKLPTNKKGVRLTKSLKVHRLVAMAFVKNSSKLKDVVIHLNHNIEDNRASNLKWVTRKELIAHSQENPKNKKKPVAKKAAAKKAVVKKVAVKKKAAIRRR